MKTIPEIADDLRRHINADNAAKRLIVEHILPLIGMNFDTVENASNAASYIDYLEDCKDSARRDVTSAIEDIHIAVAALTPGNDTVAATLTKCAAELKLTAEAYLHER